MMVAKVERRWEGRTCIVAATGPSLTPQVAEDCRGYPVIAVNDAYRLIPWADVLYACDAAWWNAHRGCPDFAGEKWSSHCVPSNDKQGAASKYGLKLVAGKSDKGFSLDPSCIHYGGNSGFQGVNLAILFGTARILMVGFDMREVAAPPGHGGVGLKKHFFGDHKPPLRNPSSFKHYIKRFDEAARLPRGGVEIINCTPGSALRGFPMMRLPEAMGGAVAA
jgi:hypothetical protein